MIETKTLLPGVTLRSCRDDRFKQGCLSFQLVRRVGDYQTTGLYCGFMDDRFALPGDRVLAPMLRFLEEILLDFPTEGEGFLPAFVEGEKKNLISTIDSELNDKRTYAMGKLLKTMCRGDSFGLPRLGEPEDVAAIDPAGLLTHYRKILRESRIEIFYVGSAPAEAVAEYISPLVSRLGGREGLLPPQTPFHPCPGQDVTETMEVSQGKLCMGFVTPIVNRDKEFPAIQVFNTVFGAGMTSKLFLNVREAMSLCYSIGSSYYGAKGILTVGAGIDFDKEQLTRDEILRQLDACRRGEITQEELTAGKEALLSSLRATSDSPGAIEGYYATAHLSGLNMTPERYMEVVEKVSLADVVAAARTVTLHSTYFLKGESQ